MPSGRFMLLSQCCPMEKVLISGTKDAATPSPPPDLTFMFPSSIHVIHVILNEELRWCQKLHKYMCLCMSSDPKLDAQRQRLSSVVAADLLPSLEGVELGAIGKVHDSPISDVENKQKNIFFGINLLLVLVVFGWGE